MKKKVNKKDALEKLADYTDWISQNHMYGVSFDHQFFLGRNRKTAVLLDSFTQEDEELLPFCKEHHIDLFILNNGSYENCETKERYHLSVSTYPGMADDTATYGNVHLIKVNQQESFWRLNQSFNQEGPQCLESELCF